LYAGPHIHFRRFWMTNGRSVRFIHSALSLSRSYLLLLMGPLFIEGA
jgi:hypothetical protein